MRRESRWFAAIACLFFSVFTLPLHALEAGDQPPAFSLQPLNAEGADAVTLEDYRGRVVYLDFWASWCGPCRLSLPALERIYADLEPQGLAVVAINLDEDGADANTFLERFPVSYDLLADPKGSTPQAYDIPGMPTAFILDREGSIRVIHAGFRKSDEAHLREYLEELLSE